MVVNLINPIFPISLEDNLFYVGNTPIKSYYEAISQADYDKLYSENGCFKEDCGCDGGWFHDELRDRGGRLLTLIYFYLCKFTCDVCILISK